MGNLGHGRQNTDINQYVENNRVRSRLQQQRYRQEITDQPDLGAGFPEVDDEQITPFVTRNLVVHVEIGNERTGDRIIAVIVIHVHMDEPVDEIGQDIGRQEGKYL